MTMQSINVETLTPKQVIEFLDKYIIGQKQAKKSLAIVLRNRWRRNKKLKIITGLRFARNILCGTSYVLYRSTNLLQKKLF